MIKKGLSNLWSIPFYYSEFKNSKKINNELTKIIRDIDLEFDSKKSYKIAGLEKGLTTKWHAYNFLDIENKNVTTLKIFIKNQVKEYFKKLGHKNSSLMYQSWANRLKEGAVLKRHSHAGPYSYISGVYYVKTKKSSSELVIFSYLKQCGESRILLRNILHSYALKIHQTKKRSSKLGVFLY